MTTAQYRELLKAMYESPKWRRKVAAMKDSQIVAIVLRLKAQGKL